MHLVKMFLRTVALLALLILADVSVAQGDNLPDSANIASVHGHPQKHSLSCEARSAADLAAYWGISLGENEFLGVLPRADNPEQGFVGNPDDPWGYMPPHSYGVHAGPVAQTLGEFGLQANAHSNLGWDDLRGEINAGHPVIVWVIGQMWPGNVVEYQAPDGSTSLVAAYEHTMILIGYSSDSVQVLDSYSGQYQTYPLSTFLQSWAVLGNMAVFSSGEPPVAASAPAEAALTQPATTEPASETYTVQPGDYLTKLAIHFGTTWPVLAELNAIPYPYAIYPGQVLQLPPAAVVLAQLDNAAPSPEQLLAEPVIEVVNFEVRLPLVVRDQDVRTTQTTAGLSSSTKPTQGNNAPTPPDSGNGPANLAVDWTLLAHLREMVFPSLVKPTDALVLR